MKFDNTLNLILQIISAGGTLVPIALAAFNEIKSETGLTTEELLDRAGDKNAANRVKLLDIINS